MASINGQEYQHALIKLSASSPNGQPLDFSLFSKLNFKKTAEKKAMNNAAGQQVGYTVDNEKTEGSFTLKKRGYYVFYDWLIQQGRGQGPNGSDLGIGQIAFDMTVTFGNLPSTRRTKRLIGVMVNEEADSSEQNQEALEHEIPLFILDITDDAGNRLINYV